jgi:glycosyltransferase involved in cell wall biosynthesis
MKLSYTKALSIQSDSRLMLFDLALGGHHGNYIQHLIEYVHKIEFCGKIDIVVLPQFLDVHKETITAISSHKYPEIKIIPISIEESKVLGLRQSGVDRALRNFREWKLFCKYAKALQTTHALIMYLDTCELPLTLGLHSPCPFFGIYFRPTFHYGLFSNHQLSWKEKFQQWRERITLGRILKHPQLQTVFCLDPFAVKEIASQQHSTKIVHLADPVQPYLSEKVDPKTLRKKLEIEQHRRIFLLFGALDERKGIYQFLEAIQLVSSELCQNLCLLLVGKTNAIEQANIQKKIAETRQFHTFQLVECYDFIPENEVPTYFQLADVVLAPYQRHVGMSGILLLAAAAGKPVLSSNYGLMGALIRHYKLGLAVDTTIPKEIAKALTRYLLESPNLFGDPSHMRVFAEQNSIDNYTSTIFQYLNLSFIPPESAESLQA